MSHRKLRPVVSNSSITRSNEHKTKTLLYEMPLHLFVTTDDYFSLLLRTTFEMISLNTKALWTQPIECYDAVIQCTQYCPCQVLCPQGCENCSNSICECKDFSTSPNYLECENDAKYRYESCVARCSNEDVACLSQCNRFYNEDLKICPCMEGNRFSYLVLKLSEYWN